MVVESREILIFRAACENRVTMRKICQRIADHTLNQVPMLGIYGDVETSYINCSNGRLACLESAILRIIRHFQEDGEGKVLNNEGEI